MCCSSQQQMNHPSTALMFPKKVDWSCKKHGMAWSHWCDTSLQIQCVAMARVGMVLPGWQYWIIWGYGLYINVFQCFLTSGYGSMWYKGNTIFRPHHKCGNLTQWMKGIYIFRECQPHKSFALEQDHQNPFLCVFCLNIQNMYYRFTVVTMFHF